jgi:hypothetical protein
MTIVTVVAVLGGTIELSEARERSLPANMRVTAGLMSDLFRSLPQDPDFMKYAQERELFQFDASDINRSRNSIRPKILLLRMDLFNLSAFVSSFHQSIMQNSLDETLFVYAKEQIKTHLENLKESFSEFSREVFREPFRERYASQLETINGHLKDVVDGMNGDFMRDVEQGIRNRQPPNAQGHLLNGLSQQILIADMAILGVVNALQ